jgi:hypothetical protein
VPAPRLRGSIVRLGTRGSEAGAALLVVLVFSVVIAGSSASFMWFMHQQQTRAGLRLRTAAAAAAAEAGVHRALAILESAARDGRAPERGWRPAYSEPLKMGALEGRYTIAIADGPGGAVMITSTGEVDGARRRLRAQVHLASPALLAALHGASLVRLEGAPASTMILPYGTGVGARTWIHIGAGRELWFATTDAAINDPARPVEVGPGPVDAPDRQGSPTRLQRPGPVRILLARDAHLTVGQDHQRVDVQQLRALGVHLDGVVLRAEPLPHLPEVDQAFYRALASANASNARLNQTAGEYLSDDDLARKQDSLYSPREFSQVQVYLQAGLAPPRLRGVIYVAGGVVLLGGQRVEIADGALVTEGTVQVSEGASLEISHSVASRALPGIVVLRAGALIVTGEARLRVHGLVYASRVIDIRQGAFVEIVGSVLGNDEGLSFRNAGGTVVIRYDPAVLGTPGLRVPDGDPVVAWVAVWEDLP